ncbi:MAG TPA: sigma-70 family RNA polymerase sigma factor [Bacteroidota bacterium]
MPAADERQLIADARNGSREAFRCLVEDHMRQAYTVAFRFVNDHHAAEEIAQEAFVRVYESLHAFREEAGFATWLHRIVTNLALNRLKATKRRNEERLDTTVHGALAATDAPAGADTDLQEHIERALHELPTLQRAVVILRHMNGLSTKEVGRILQCSEGTVKTHLFRGLEKMREKLQYLRGDLA